jgi:DNA-binding NtrC family response regulator
VRQLAGVCVLVVEDETLIALMTQTMLRDRGCEVVGVAPTLADGMQFIRANLHRLDAVALDINLGGEIAAPLVTLLEENDIPFIVMTGYPNPEQVVLISKVPVLQKPFMTEHLIMALVSLR